MPMIWNDKNFISREIKALKSSLKTELFSFPIVALILYIFLIDDVTKLDYFVLIFTISGWVVLMRNLFFKLPNSYIDEKNDSKSIKQQTRWLQFIISHISLYVIVIGILYHYYPSLEVLICCDFVKNFQPLLAEQFTKL